jgi:hypothetical protein
LKTQTVFLRPVRGLDGDVHGERGLSHAGARADEDEVRLAHADDDVVEGLEPGRRSAQGFGVGGEGLEAVVDLQKGVADVDEVLVLPSLRDAVDLPLGVFHKGFRVVVPGVSRLGDILARADELAEDGPVADDLRVVLGVDGGGDGLGDELEVFAPSGLGVGAGLGQLVNEGDDVDILRFEVHGLHGKPDFPVLGHVEVVRRHEGGHLVHTPRVDEHRSQKGLLRLQRKRQPAIQFVIHKGLLSFVSGGWAKRPSPIKTDRFGEVERNK